VIAPAAAALRTPAGQTATSELPTAVARHPTAKITTQKAETQVKPREEAL
jgi:hypothetical protein